MDERMPEQVRHVMRRTAMSRRGFLRLGGGAAAGTALLGTSGCGIFGGGQESGATSKTLLRNLTAEIRYFDSVLATDEISAEVLLNVREGLYRLDRNETPQPAMAKSYELSEDELTYTFTLRDGITWSNGDPVTAQHFRFAWLRAMDPETASQYAYILADFIKGGAAFNEGTGKREDVAIEAPDDKTLKVTINFPAPFFLGLTTFWVYQPQNEQYVKQKGERYGKGPDNILYNGPFTMTSYDVQKGGTLVKNEKYWDKGAVDINRIEMEIVKDRDTALRLYKEDKLDIVELSGDQAARHEDDPDFFRFIGFTHFFGVMNQGDPAMANVNIRRAMMIGFDRAKLAKQVLQDGSEPAYAFVPPGMEGPKNKTFREAGGDLVPKDPAKAKQYWDKGVQELGGAPQITMLFGDSTTNREVATFIQNQYRQHLGIDARIEITTFENALDRVDRRDYQISYASGWGADYNDPLTFMTYFLSNSGSNRTGFSDARYDELVHGAQTETNNTKRMRMMLEAEKILFEQAVLAPEYYAAVVGLMKPWLKNYTTHPYGAEPDWKFARLEGKPA